MIYLDNGHGLIKESLTFFREHKHHLGEIVGCTMKDFIDSCAVFNFKLKGTMAEVWLSGCAAGYDSESSDGTITIPKELGYPDDACDIVPTSRRFSLLSPERWKPKAVKSKRHPSQGVLASAYEVLDFLEDFHAERKIMPTAREIKAGCKSIMVAADAHERLRLLQDLGHIRVTPRKSREIILLDRG